MIWADKGWITAAGARLEIACFGPPPGEAPTVVLLHEGLGCVALWRDLPNKIAEMTGLGVLAYSRAGYGASDPTPMPWPLDYMTRHARGVLPEIVADLDEFILLGHSDGGSIAAIFAGESSDPRLQGVALIAPHFFTEDVGLRAIAAAKQAYETGDLRAKLVKYHSNVDCAFRGWNDSWLHPEFRAWDIRKALEGISVPILAMQGDADPYGTLAQIDAISEQASAPLTTRIFPDIGHAPHQETPKQCMDVMAEFFTDICNI